MSDKKEAPLGLGASFYFGNRSRYLAILLVRKLLHRPVSK